MRANSYHCKKLSLFFLNILFSVLFIATQSNAESVEFQTLVSPPVNNRQGILIGRGTNPLPPYNPTNPFPSYNQTFQIELQTVTSRNNGTAWCGRAGDPACTEIYYREAEFTVPSFATNAIFTTSGAIGASITPQGQVCANLLLNIYDQSNTLVLRKTVGNHCRIGTASLRLGDRSTLTNSFGISLNPSALYKVRPSIQCVYGNMAFNGGKHHCEAFTATTKIQFLGNEPISGQPPQIIVVDPPIEVLPHPGGYIFY